MAYTTINDPTEYFQAVLFTGNTVNIPVNLNMRPDWLWLKSRTQTYSNLIYDTSRPADGSTMPSGDVNMYASLSTDTGNAESDNNADGLVQTSTGFIVDGDGQAIGEANQGADNMVAWCWKANGGSTTTNDSSSTGIGSIDSVYQVNSTAKFSIVTYTGNGSSGANFAHGLGVVPELVIIKNRDTTRSWFFGHHKIGWNHIAGHLNSTDDQDEDSVYWNNTAPTSTVITLGNNEGGNESGDKFVAYCFKEVQGYSKFGTYEGNGAEPAGPFIYTGFKPAFILIHAYSESGQAWFIGDNKRDPNNMAIRKLATNTNSIESAASGDNNWDFLSNGFRIVTQDDAMNKDGVSYLYMAFAESPFVTSNGGPNNAQ